MCASGTIGRSNNSFFSIIPKFAAQVKFSQLLKFEGGRSLQLPIFVLERDAAAMSQLPYTLNPGRGHESRPLRVLVEVCAANKCSVSCAHQVSNFWNCQILISIFSARKRPVSVPRADRD